MLHESTFSCVTETVVLVEQRSTKAWFWLMQRTATQRSKWNSLKDTSIWEIHVGTGKIVAAVHFYGWVNFCVVAIQAFAVHGVKSQVFASRQSRAVGMDVIDVIKCHETWLHNSSIKYHHKVCLRPCPNYFPGEECVRATQCNCYDCCSFANITHGIYNK